MESPIKQTNQELIAMNVIDTIYSKSFDELNEEQKEKAIDVMRELDRHDSDPFWAQLINEDKRELMDNEYGFTDTVIHYSGFCSQGDGASISTESIDAETFLRKIKAWSKFRVLHKHFNDGNITLKIARNDHRYSHENTVYGVVDLNYYTEFTAKQEEKAEELETLLTETIRDLSRQHYQVLSDENDYQNSDEALIESINANDYNFKVNSTGNVLGLA